MKYSEVMAAIGNDEYVFQADSHPGYLGDPEINLVPLAELDRTRDEIFVWF